MCALQLLEYSEESKEEKEKEAEGDKGILDHVYEFLGLTAAPAKKEQ